MNDNAAGAGSVELGLVIEAVFGGLPLEERMRRVAEVGFRTIEFWMADRLCPNPEELARLAQRAGLRVNSLVMVSPDGGIGGGLTDPEKRPEMLSRLRTCLDYARAAGIGAGIVCTGNRVDGMSDEAVRQSVLDGLKAATELAEAAGVTLLLEALNTAHDHPGYWLTGSDAGAALCREVGSPRLRLLYDCYHMQISEGDLAVHIERNIDVIGHFHAAGVPGRHEPYAGEINYPFLLEHIRRLGYRGVFALEYGPSIDDQESLRRCRAHLSGATADREGEVDA